MQVGKGEPWGCTTTAGVEERGFLGTGGAVSGVPGYGLQEGGGSLVMLGGAGDAWGSWIEVGLQEGCRGPECRGGLGVAGHTGGAGGVLSPGGGGTEQPPLTCSPCSLGTCLLCSSSALFPMRIFWTPSGAYWAGEQSKDPPTHTAGGPPDLPSCTPHLIHVAGPLHDVLVGALTADVVHEEDALQGVGGRPLTPQNCASVSPLLCTRPGSPHTCARR